MPAACEKKPAPPAKPACNCDDDLSPEPLYRVQVGAYRNKNNADRMLNSLLIEGFPAFIIYENDAAPLNYLTLYIMLCTSSSFITNESLVLPDSYRSCPSASV